MKVKVPPVRYCLFLKLVTVKSSWLVVFFFNKFIHFIYLFLAELGLHCCARAFSSCGKQGLLFVAVRGLLIAVASLVVD